jgi:hypothetical protein
MAFVLGLQKDKSWAGGRAQVVECLLCKHKALSTKKVEKKKKDESVWAVVTHSCNPSY